MLEPVTVCDITLNPLLWPILIAAAAGLLALVLSRWSRLACKVIALLASGCVLACGIAILSKGSAPFDKTWIEITETVSFDIHLMADGLGGLSGLVVLGAGAFGVLITLYSLSDMAGSRWEGKFYTYLIWSLMGASIVGLAGNLLVLLVGWEIVTLMLFLMVNQGREGAPKGAFKAYAILGFSDACLLLAVVLLLSLPGGSANLALFPGAPTVVGSLGWIGYAIYALILIAALAKAGAIPLHTWLPDIAKDAPTPVMAFLPAAMDKLLGIYLLAVLALGMFEPDKSMQVIMIVIGAVTILCAVLMAMMQHNLKRLLSFHAVSQVGYMVLGIGTGTVIGVIGGLFHMLNNTIYKSNLFLMSGTVGRASGSDEIEDMGGLARALPVTFVCAVISAAAISGVPPFNGFASKWLVYQGALSITNRPLALIAVIVAVFGSALTLASFVKVIYAAFLSPVPRDRAAQRPPASESVVRVVPMVVLAAACILFGLWPGLITHGVLAKAVPEAVQKASADAGQQITAEGTALQTGELGYWSPGGATGLILIGLALGLIFLALTTIGKRARIVRPFLGGEVPEPDDDRFRVPGTGFYATIAQLPLIGPWLTHGEQGAMDPYHWSERHGNTFVQFLRGLHTGLISLYVAWCLSGLTIILVYLLVART